MPPKQPPAIGFSACAPVNQVNKVEAIRHTRQLVADGMQEERIRGSTPERMNLKAVDAIDFSANRN
jgi:hypothetical protein